MQISGLLLVVNERVGDYALIEITSDVKRVYKDRSKRAMPSIREMITNALAHENCRVSKYASPVCDAWRRTRPISS